MVETIRFSYSVFADSLEQQANAHGFTLGDEFKRLDAILHSIHMCGFHVATESQVSSMITKLNKKVVSALLKVTETVEPITEEKPNGTI